VAQYKRWPTWASRSLDGRQGISRERAARSLQPAELVDEAEEARGLTNRVSLDAALASVEKSAAMSLSAVTVKRGWTVARLWLRRELS
jgi:hypothetical protein